MAPVSGAIFLFASAAGFTNVCDKSARTAIHSNNGFASWHIAYKNGSIALPNEKGAFWGTALRYGDKQPDRRWNMGASHDFPLLRMANLQLAERSGCRADGPLLQFQPVIDRRRQPPRQ
jgi:hypothetical protein